MVQTHGSPLDSEAVRSSCGTEKDQHDQKCCKYSRAKFRGVHGQLLLLQCVKAVFPEYWKHLYTFPLMLQKCFGEFKVGLIL